jgi:hypothetical protein
LGDNLGAISEVSDSPAGNELGANTFAADQKFGA